MNLADAPAFTDDNTQVKDIFTIPATVTDGSYTDALYYSLADWAALSADQWLADRMERYTNWLAAIHPPPWNADDYRNDAATQAQNAQSAKDAWDADASQIEALDPGGYCPPFPTF